MQKCWLVEDGNKYCTEMCSVSEAGSYLRLIDFVYHSTLGLGVIKKTKGRTGESEGGGARGQSCLLSPAAVSQ